MHTKAICVASIGVALGMSACSASEGDTSPQDEESKGTDEALVRLVPTNSGYAWGTGGGFDPVATAILTDAILRSPNGVRYPATGNPGLFQANYGTGMNPAANLFLNQMYGQVMADPRNGPFERAFATGFMNSYRNTPAGTFGGGGGCDYSRAFANGGWGWNPMTRTSCPPL